MSNTRASDSPRHPKLRASKPKSTSAYEIKTAGQDAVGGNEHISADANLQALESLLSFSAILRHSADLPATLERCVSEIVYRNCFDVGVLTSVVPGWPSLCSSARSDLDAPAMMALANMAKQHLGKVQQITAAAGVPFRVLEDPGGKLLGPSVRGVLELPIVVDDRPLALLLLAFKDPQSPTAQQTRVASAMVQLLEATLLNRTWGAADAMDRAKETRSSHLETLGRLAAGVAHDFNNLLQGLLGYASLLEMSVGSANPKVHSYLEGLENEVAKGGSLSEQLLTMSRRGSVASEPVDVAALVEDVAQVIGRTIDRRIEVSTHIVSPKVTLMAVRTELMEVLTSMCLNARDLLPEGGTIDITVTTVPAAQLPFKTGSIQAWSQWLCLEVAAAVPEGKAINPGSYWGCARNAFSSEDALSGGSMRGIQELAGRHRSYFAIFTNLMKGSTVKLFISIE
jgi:nitrogen-specific signal transduction histidine kinase